MQTHLFQRIITYYDIFHQKYKSNTLVIQIQVIPFYKLLCKWYSVGLNTLPIHAKIIQAKLLEVVLY